MADLVIAGGGPQALALCALLLQKRPRWPGTRNLFGGREAAARIVAALRQDR